MATKLKTLFFIIFFFLVFKENSFAASINVSPSGGGAVAGKSFTVNINLSGDGKTFNASQANISVSGNLSVENVVLGSCDFAFVKTPNPVNLSFAGVILGGSSTNCNVYQMVLKAVSPGTGTINITEPSIKEYKTAAEILTSFKNGSFSITAPVNYKPPSPTPISSSGVKTAGSGGYTVIFKVTSEEGVPIPGAEVTLNSADQNPSIPPKTTVANESGVVEFKNVSKGVHKVSVKLNNEIVTDNIINVAGENESITMGIQAQKPKPSILPFVFIILVIIIALCAPLAVFLIRRRNMEKESFTV